jgi:hypothetical protein
MLPTALARGLALSERFLYISTAIAGIAQLVERNLAKVDVAGSSPVSRSAPKLRGYLAIPTLVELRCSLPL